MTNVSDFFLGCSSPHGFFGFWKELQGEDGPRLYLIKSGPGCGKSTLMKELARRADGPVQQIHCSSDPDSLDGVYFEKQNAMVLDAYDRRDITITGTIVADNPAFRRLITQLKLTEPVSNLDTVP